MEYNFETLLVDVSDGVALVTLNRPEVLNALGGQGLNELAAVFNQMRLDDEVRAVVITGAGRAFCAGGDVAEMEAGEINLPYDLLSGRIGTRDKFLPMQGFEKPVVVAVNGVAAGGGASIVLGGDIVYASEKASFSIVFARIGLVPDSGSLFLLTRAVGPAKAKELAMTADIIDAAEMYRIGLAQKVLPPDELLPAAMKLAKRLAAGPSLALGAIKAMVDRSATMTIEEYYDLEAMTLAFITQSADFKEGINAFVEKRKANFTGR